jgi:hypothetical protein
MCVRVTCPTCSKPTYSGCGAHIEMVLGDVAPAERCKCREAKSSASKGAKGASQSVPWFRR